MLKIIFIALLALALVPQAYCADLDAQELVAPLLVKTFLADDKAWEALIYIDRIAAAPETSVSRRAEAFRQAGELRLQLGDFPGADNDFRRALELVPGDSGLLYLRALAMRERPEEALPYADRAANAANAAAVERAKANLLAGELRVDIGDADGAQKSLALALKDAPDDLDALYAMVRLKRGRKSAALAYAEHADRAAANTPLWGRPAAYRRSASIWLELEEHARAAANLRLALQSNPEDIDALGALVRMKSKLSPKQLAGLRRTALAAVAGNEKEPKASSEKDPERALKRNPNDLEALRQLIAFNRDRRRLAEAAAYAELFGSAVWKTPVWQRAEANRVLAALWLDLGDYNKVKSILDRARDLNSDAIQTWQMIAALPGGERDNLPTHIYCTAAQMRLELDDRAGAQENIQQALQVEPNNGWALRLMAALKKTL